MLNALYWIPLAKCLVGVSGWLLVPLESQTDTLSSTHRLLQTDDNTPENSGNRTSDTQLVVRVVDF